MIGSTYYPSVNEAYTSATTGQEIKMKSLTFTETPELSRGVNVTLKGGYNCAYSSNTGYTTIGAVKISGGSVKVSNIIIK